MQNQPSEFSCWEICVSELFLIFLLSLSCIFLCVQMSSKMRTIAFFRVTNKWYSYHMLVITISDSSVGSLRIILFYLFSSSCLLFSFFLLLCSMTLPSCTTLMNHCVFTRELKTGHPPNWPYLRTFLMFIFTLYKCMYSMMQNWYF